MLSAISNIMLDVGKQISGVIFVPCFIALMVFSVLFIVDLIKNWGKDNESDYRIETSKAKNKRQNGKTERLRLIEERRKYLMNNKVGKAKCD